MPHVLDFWNAWLAFWSFISQREKGPTFIFVWQIACTTHVVLRGIDHLVLYSRTIDHHGSFIETARISQELRGISAIEHCDLPPYPCTLQHCLSLLLCSFSFYLPLHSNHPLVFHSHRPLALLIHPFPLPFLAVNFRNVSIPLATVPRRILFGAASRRSSHVPGLQCTQMSLNHAYRGGGRPETGY